MRPGKNDWATNSLYAAGAGAGSPTKAPPAAGPIADGYQPDTMVSAQIWNYARWALAVMVAGCRSERLLNWEEIDVTNLGIGFIGGVGDGIYEPVAKTHV